MSKKIFRTVAQVAGAVAVTLAIPGLGPAIAAAVGLGSVTALPTRRDNVKTDQTQ